MLQINLVVEVSKISLDQLEEQIQEIVQHVQSTDVAGEYCDPARCPFVSGGTAIWLTI